MGTAQIGLQRYCAGLQNFPVKVFSVWIQVCTSLRFTMGPEIDD